MSDLFPTTIKTTLNAPTSIETQKAIAEVQGSIIIAQRCPRDQRAALDRILMACGRPTLAERAVYSYPRGGTDVTGPSIRLAEAIAQQWGNFKSGFRILSSNDKESIVETYAWDMETNTKSERVFNVSHERHTKSSVKLLTDPRDIYEKVANEASRRVRSCILAIIPGDIVEEAMRVCNETLRNSTPVTKESVKSLMDAFAEFKVTPQMIEKRLGRNILNITSQNIVGLKNVYQSLRDGFGEASDFFTIEEKPEEQPKSAMDALLAKEEPVIIEQQATPTLPPVSANDIEQIRSQLSSARELSHVEAVMTKNGNKFMWLSDNDMDNFKALNDLAHEKRQELTPA